MIFGPLIVLTALTAPAAGADDLRLLYETSVPGCPDEVTFRALVAERLRRDPFRAGAARALRVEIAKQDQKLVAEIAGEGADRVAAGSRHIEAGLQECPDLAAAAALAVAIAIDPRAAAGPAPAALIAVPAPTPPPPPPAPAPPPAKRWFATAGLGIGQGNSPEQAPLTSLGAGVKEGWLSMGLEGAWLYPTTLAYKDVEGARIHSQAFLLALLGCASWRTARLCALADGGRLWAEGRGFPEDRALSRWLGGVGGRAGVSVALAQNWDLEISLQGIWRFSPVTLIVDKTRAWTMPRFGMSVLSQVRFAF